MRIATIIIGLIFCSLTMMYGQQSILRTDTNIVEKGENPTITISNIPNLNIDTIIGRIDSLQKVIEEVQKNIPCEKGEAEYIPWYRCVPVYGWFLLAISILIISY